MAKIRVQICIHIILLENATLAVLKEGSKNIMKRGVYLIAGVGRQILQIHGSGFESKRVFAVLMYFTKQHP